VSFTTPFGPLSGAGTVGTSTPLSFADLEQLWIGAGGNIQLAPEMAGIAEIESGGGQPGAYNVSGPDTSFGLWQINVQSNANPQFAPQAQAGTIFQPGVNAADAVAIYTSQGLGAWAAETSPTLASGQPNPKYQELQQVIATGGSVGTATGGGPTANSPFGVSDPAAASGVNASQAQWDPLGLSEFWAGVTGQWQTYWTAHPLWLLLGGIVLVIVAFGLLGGGGAIIDVAAPEAAAANAARKAT